MLIQTRIQSRRQKVSCRDRAVNPIGDFRAEVIALALGQAALPERRNKVWSLR